MRRTSKSSKRLQIANEHHQWQEINKSVGPIKTNLLLELSLGQFVDNDRHGGNNGSVYGNNIPVNAVHSARYEDFLAGSLFHA